MSDAGAEPAIVSKVRAMCDAADRVETERNVEILWAILQWLYERRMLDEDGVDLWTDGPNDRVVAEGRRRLVRTRGKYEGTQAPNSQEIAASELFVELRATPLSVVRQLQGGLPHQCPEDVTEGLAALERLLTA